MSPIHPLNSIHHSSAASPKLKQKRFAPMRHFEQQGFATAKRSLSLRPSLQQDESTVFIMATNARAGTAPYRRRGRVATLPKMTNSERGKYYRRKYKEHELHLEASVLALRKQVRDLKKFLNVRDTLASYNPSDSCDSIVAHIFEYFVRSREGMRFDSSFFAMPAPSPHQNPQQSRMYEWDDSHMFLRFSLRSFDVKGSSETPVVVMRGVIHAQYSRSTIDALFPHLLHDTELLAELLDKEVQYPCTYHFYFTTDGTLHDKIVEADYVHGLQQVLGQLDDVMWLLNGSHRLRQRHDSLVDIIRGPPSMDLDFILS